MDCVFTTTIITIRILIIILLPLSASDLFMVFMPTIIIMAVGIIIIQLIYRPPAGANMECTCIIATRVLPVTGHFPAVAIKSLCAGQLLRPVMVFIPIIVMVQEPARQEPEL